MTNVNRKDEIISGDRGLRQMEVEAAIKTYDKHVHRKHEIISRDRGHGQMEMGMAKDQRQTSKVHSLWYTRTTEVGGGVP